MTNDGATSDHSRDPANLALPESTEPSVPESKSAEAATEQQAKAEAKESKRLDRESKWAPAVFGLLGTLVGALVGLVGSYLGIQGEDQRADEDFKRQYSREAYADYQSQTAVLRAAMLELYSDALYYIPGTDDPSVIYDGYDIVDAARLELEHRYAMTQLVGSSEVMPAVERLYDAYGDVSNQLDSGIYAGNPPEHDFTPDVDELYKFEAQMFSIAELEAEFLDVARNDLFQDD